jgi:thiol-disulfide isomerase/thioredoxin
MHRHVISLSVAASIVASSLFAYSQEKQCRPASDNYYADGQRGWFWAEPTCNENNKTKQAQNTKKYKLLPKKVDIPWDIIDQIDPSEIAKIEEESRKISLMYPTDYNIKQERLLQQYAMKKSVNYAQAGDLLGRKDTDLARWRAEQPMTAFKKNVGLRDRYNKAEEILKSFSDKAGLVVVTKEGCPYCRAQMPILAMLKQETGFTYKEVDVMEAPLLIKNLEVATTPDIFLVVNDGGEAKWQRVATGLNTLDEIKQAVVAGLYGLGEIKDSSLIYQ